MSHIAEPIHDNMLSRRTLAQRLTRTPFDPFILVAILLGLLLFAPLLQAGLPQAPDGVLHFYRTALWRWAWDDGMVWPRWHTLLYQGYGYPALHYNGPLPYVVAALLSYALPSLEAAYKGMLLLACLGYAVGTYLWTKEFLSPWGALVAAAAFTFAPFRYRELYYLGGYCQFFAWSLYPWVLFFFHRLTAHPSRHIFLAAVTSLAGLALSHNISVLLFAPFFGTYLLGLLLGYRKTQPWRRLSGAILCGLASVMVFWLPALSEMSFGRTEVLTQGHWDIAVHMLRLKDFFAATTPLDSRAALAPLPFNFGRWPLFLAALGVLTAAWSRQSASRQRHVAFGGVVMVGAAFMMLPVSLPVWRAIPFLEFAEYPFRMYGWAALGVAVLSGAAISWVERWPRLRLAAVITAVVGLILAVAVYQFPKPFVTIEPTPAGFLSYETAYRAWGTTGGDEFLSQAVLVKPDKPAVTTDLQRTAFIESPTGVTGEVRDESANSLRIAVAAAAPASVTLAQFYFPGWRAWLNGAPIPLRSAEKTGLIELDVPAGQHDLALAFGDTPIRIAGGWISLAGLLATAIVALQMRPHNASPLNVTSGSRPEAALVSVLLVSLALLTAAWIGPHTSWFRLTSPPDRALPAQHPVNLTLNEKVALIGYDLERASARQGEELHIRLYWQALEPLDSDYASFVKLKVRSDGQVLAQSDHVHPGNLPAATWRPEQYVVDDHTLRVPADAPAVAVQITTGLYRNDDMTLLGSVEIPGKAHILARRGPSITGIHRSSASLLGEGIRLLGHRVYVESGVMRLTLFWQADTPQTISYQVFVHVLASDGSTIVQADGPPVGGLYLTSDWLPGQIIADSHDIQLPNGITSARVEVGLYDLQTLRRAFARTATDTVWLNDAVVINLGLPH